MREARTRTMASDDPMAAPADPAAKHRPSRKRSSVPRSVRASREGGGEVGEPAHGPIGEWLPDGLDMLDLADFDGEGLLQGLAEELGVHAAEAAAGADGERADADVSLAHEDDIASLARPSVEGFVDEVVMAAEVASGAVGLGDGSLASSSDAIGEFPLPPPALAPPICWESFSDPADSSMG